ncbi:MAG: 50S ribosomal protein L9 [Alphaproteobacteria bacterium]
MEVILLERITRLGGVGDVVNVKNGYARNYLIPQKKVLRATEENKKVFEARRAEIEKDNAEKKAAAQEIAKTLDGLSLKLVRQASQEGKLYGSIAVRDVAEALLEANHDVPKSQIVMSGTIKNTGEYPVRIVLHAEVTANITVSVERHEVDAA